MSGTKKIIKGESMAISGAIGFAEPVDIIFPRYGLSK